MQPPWRSFVSESVNVVREQLSASVVYRAPPLSIAELLTNLLSNTLRMPWAAPPTFPADELLTLEDSWWIAGVLHLHMHVRFMLHSTGDLKSMFIHKSVPPLR